MAMSGSVSRAALALGLASAVLAGGAAWRLSAVTPAASDRSTASLYDFTVTDLGGHPVALAEYRGQVTLVVNVASECGLAFQYPELDTLYQRYRSRGFVILAFPSNDFWQEPNDEAGIQQVCDARGVTFPVFARSHVRGRNSHRSTDSSPPPARPHCGTSRST
jgi:hypothetical protein